MTFQNMKNAALNARDAVIPHWWWTTEPGRKSRVEHDAKIAEERRAAIAAIAAARADYRQQRQTLQAEVEKARATEREALAAYQAAVRDATSVVRKLMNAAADCEVIERTHRWRLRDTVPECITQFTRWVRVEIDRVRSAGESFSVSIGPEGRGNYADVADITGVTNARGVERLLRALFAARDEAEQLHLTVATAEEAEAAVKRLHESIDYGVLEERERFVVNTISLVPQGGVRARR